MGHRRRRRHCGRAALLRALLLRAFVAAVTMLWAALASGAADNSSSAMTSPDPQLSGGKDLRSAWDGYQELIQVAVRELGEQRVSVDSTIDWKRLTPRDSLVLIHPESLLRASQLFALLQSGGRLAVVDDFGTGDQILAPFGSERVPPPDHPRAMLRHNQNFPLAVPAPDFSGSGSHALSDGIGHVVTNHPTGIVNPKLSPVLRIQTTNEGDVVVAMAGVVGDGRLLAISDSSMFINQSMRYPGNRTFATRVMRYLMERPGREHAGTLHIVVGAFEERGAYGNDAWQDELADRLASFRRAWRQVGQTGLPPLFAPLLSLCMAAACSALLFTVAGRRFHARVPRFARGVPLLAQGGYAGRAAVLAAPSTPNALVMLEIKKTLEEELSLLLGLERDAAPGTLMDAVRLQRALDALGIQQLQTLFLRVSTLETTVLAGRPAKVGDNELRRTHEIVRKLLQMAKQRMHSRESAT